MARDILSGFGRDSSQPQASSASNGGRLEPKDVMNYKSPIGPANINDAKSPSLHGINHGCAPGQGKH